MVSDKELLGLIQSDIEKAWDIILRDYSDYIYTIIRKNVYRRDDENQDSYQDRIANVYLYILERLQEDEYRRLKSFRGYNLDTTYYSKFTTWLTTVCQRSCFDCLRREAPPDIPESIERLSEEHRTEVYVIACDLFYRKGYNRSECFSILTINHGFNLSYGEFLKVMDEIDTTLTDAQRKRFLDYLRTRFLISLDVDATDEEDELNNKEYEYRIPSEDRTPDEEVITDENVGTLEKLKVALRICIEPQSDKEKGLTDSEWMIIKLAYWKGKKPRDVAKIMGISNKKASKYRITAEGKLRKCLEEKGYPLENVSEAFFNLGIL